MTQHCLTQHGLRQLGYKGLCWLGVFWLLGMPAAWADSLSDRVERFPYWQRKPTVSVVNKEDLVYPDWMAGTWDVTSTLLQLEAPLAPDLKSPGFEGNRRYLNQPLEFQVRFQPQKKTGLVVGDRSFNSQNISNAYFGEESDIEIIADSENPNRQIIDMAGGQELVSVVRGRNREQPEGDRFLATEIIYQVFRSPGQIYFNEVETTTDYHKQDADHLEAEQLTAIYLSPKDPAYFRANGSPVALYRYHLDLRRSSGSKSP